MGKVLISVIKQISSLSKVWVQQLTDFFRLFLKTWRCSTLILFRLFCDSTQNCFFLNLSHSFENFAQNETRARTQESKILRRTVWMRGEREGGWERERERDREGEREREGGRERGRPKARMVEYYFPSLFHFSGVSFGVRARAWYFFLLLNSFRKKRRSYSEISSNEDSLLKGEISTTEVQLIGDLLG